MVRVLMRAGQFAHLDQATIEAKLDELWNPNLRFAKHEGRYSNDGEEEAVPWVLVKAKAYISEPLYDANTINFIGSAEGVTCCLCLNIEKVPGYAVHHWVPSDFIHHVCPTFLRHAGPRNEWNKREWGQYGQPLCSHCRRAISNKLWREYGMNDPKVPRDAWNGVLAHLAANPVFRKRVLLHANNLARLRFDPRVVPTRGQC